MFKRLCGILIFGGVLATNSLGFAHSVLEKSVVDTLKSDNFLIRYELINVTSDASETVEQYYKENSNVVTVAKLGDSVLTITDSYKKGKLAQSIGFLKKDGVDYAISAMGKPCHAGNGLANFKTVSVLPVDSVKQVFDGNFFAFKYHFLPFMPEENKAVGALDGKEAIMNICNVYQKDGKQVIAGVEHDYVEYKTSDALEVVSKGRYYFKDGKIVNYIRIDKDGVIATDQQMQELIGLDQIKFGGYAKVKVLDFTQDVHPNFFVLPKGVKVYRPKGIENMSSGQFY